MRFVPQHGEQNEGVRGRVAVGVGVAVVALGLVARVTFADTSATSFRTATVTRDTVLQTLDRVGTIEPVAQATVAFPVAGTVASVAAKVGDTVTAGQTLATLDTTTQSGELATKQAALAAAQLTLDQAVNGPVTSATGAATTGTSATTNVQGTSVDLSPALQQVLNGQKQVDADLGAAQVALGTAADACRPPAATADTTPTPPSSGLGTAACVAAQQQAFGAQQAVAAGQQWLAEAESVLDAGLAQAIASGASARSGGSSGTAASQQSGSPQSAPTTAQLVADQATVDAAEAAVRVAQQNIDQATVVSPIAGTVGAVNLLPGQQVSAGSSTANAVVVGEGGWEVATTVTVDDVDKVKTGQTATVVPDGTGERLGARLVSIGVAATTTGTATTYPVVVGFTASPAGLHNGASASVAIELARATDALTVPTSAVRTVGTLHVAAVMTSGKSHTVPVQVGTVGSERTEVTSGLSVGQEVVLADLNRPLPASNSTNTGGGLGGLGRGGFGGDGIRTGGGRPGG